ncbi:S8 family serine peptidase [Gemmata sp. G18]|uniref:S8 family serine peptidase n=1 Tax=Gemmata palustris TaxID=2822762 RepID=A0ABS5BXT0_9BACT|nr:S8 family serine peptidase [Gemmata palustris]MBP3958514.1 S8 family serine peptidase [Gemmata palustris]
MPHVNFGTKNEAGFDLVESPDLIAVRTRSRRSVTGVGPVPLPATAEVADGTLVTSFPDAGVEVYRVPTRARSVDERKRTLRAAPDVQFAGSVLVHPDTGEPVLYTENLYIRFREDVDPDDCEAIIRSAGLTVKEQLDFATNAYSVAAPEGTGQKVFEIAQTLLNRPDVIYCHPELIQRRRRKQIFPQQWHLKATTVDSVAVNAHANVEAAHAITRGAGVTIAVIDDGVDIDHPEFAGTGKIVAPRDATLETSDPRPKDTIPSRSRGDNHGTACAGVATANGTEGASGVAPQARLMPIRLADGLGSMREAKAFRWAADNGADVISCSWGPEDGEWFNAADPLHTTPFRLPASSKDAIDYAVTNGRGGRGCVVLFAAGNGNESVDIDGYASYENVIAVAACNDRSKRSVYSDFGTAVWCAFPSSDFGHQPFSHPDPLTTGIWTTDRVGRFGYNPGNTQFGDAAGRFANDFGGTSSSCPGAAGVAALVLAANPELRWNEVKELFSRACDKIDPAGGNYDANGHSDFYGYGRLNAETAVRLARENIGRVVILNMLLNEPIPDLGTVEGSVTAGETALAEKVAVSVRLRHTYIGDLVVTVVPPPASDLAPVVLHNRAGGSRDDIDMLYDESNTPALRAYRGAKCNGKWTVRVEDRAAQDSGTLEQIGVQLFLPPARSAPHSVSTPRAGEAKPHKNGKPGTRKVIKGKK